MRLMNPQIPQAIACLRLNPAKELPIYEAKQISAPPNSTNANFFDVAVQ